VKSNKVPSRPANKKPGRRGLDTLPGWRCRCGGMACASVGELPNKPGSRIISKGGERELGRDDDLCCPPCH
jgi:hypothetical protein